MSSWILIMVIAMGNTGNTQLPVTSTSVEFNTQQACETARENVRQKLNSKAQVILLTCEKKHL